MASNKPCQENGNNVPETRSSLHPIIECCQATPFTFSSDNFTSSGNISQEVDDLTSNATINFISQILLEEGIDDEITDYQDEAALLDTEKSFYDVLQQESPSPNIPQLHSHQNKNTTFGDSSTSGDCNSRSYNKIDPLLVSDKPTTGSLSASQIKKGSEEAMKFFQTIRKLFLGLDPTRIGHEENINYYNKNQKTVIEPSFKISSLDREPNLLGGPTHKYQAVFSNEPVRNDNFDELLLSRGQEYFKQVLSLREFVQKETSMNSQEHFKDLGNETENGVEQITGKSVADLQSLLVHCSEAVSASDYSTAYELINKIRHHSSPKGDCFQRLAHYIANGLEARLAGTGSEIYHELISKHGSAIDHLKAFCVYFSACPYLRASYYFANETIISISKDAPKVHIIDFGINFGYQWPGFFERLSSLGTTQPKIRITGIDFPEKGFRPAKRVDETGRRLSEYAERFGICFDYQGIASKWENIKIEDLKIHEDEIVIVNSLYSSRNLADETLVAVNCPREKVLSMIRKIKPRVFIHGIVNASYSTPLFPSRFKECLKSYLSFFDMCDTTMPRESEGRVLLERFVSPKLYNVIACEGTERVERAENYKKWQARNIRAGLMQLPVNSIIMKKIKKSVRELYHKEFFVDEDNKWLLLGWKGSISQALSTWKTDESESVDCKTNK
ncbi:hypothetical protein LUZ61_012997 [Rhynchospora tenuis]|uniref:Scarecrow-like protein 9 n=1 Tax=Rhynchospora tenuis TaxID=198213 RepID=A0AAD6A3Z3_9POAL|nr:hypothetical protein LUZ61_012997 [Rhynchospora tenuis]